jgi:hypothetical protein
MSLFCRSEVNRPSSRPHARPLAALAAALQGQGELGNGQLFRTIRATQRRFFDPPQLDHARGVPHRRLLAKARPTSANEMVKRS